MSKRARCHIAASFWSLSSLSSYYSHRRRSGDMSLISRKRGRNIDVEKPRWSAGLEDFRRTYSRISDLGISRRMQMLLFHISRFPEASYLRRTAFQTAKSDAYHWPAFPAKTFRHGNQFRRVAPRDSSLVNRHRCTNTSFLCLSFSFCQFLSSCSSRVHPLRRLSTFTSRTLPFPCYFSFSTMALQNGEAI